MSFATPDRLWWLVAILALTLWVGRGRARRQRDWSELGLRGYPPSEHEALELVALTLLVVALAGPRWGRAASDPLPPGHDVVLLVDVSRSMAVEDAVPNRLAVAVDAAGSLVEALGRESGSRVAVVAFEGRARVRCPLTENLGAVMETLRALRPGDLRPGGTDLGAALDVALTLLVDAERAEGRSVVIFSDGEDHAGTWTNQVERLRAARVPVFAIGLGDAALGHPVPVDPDGVPLRHDGRTVLSRRVDFPLERLARTSSGVFLPLGLSAVDLGALYRARIEPSLRRTREARSASGRASRGGPFVLAAWACTLAASGHWQGHRLSLSLMAMVLGLATLGASPKGDHASDLVERGRRAYSRGQFDSALAAFEAALQLDPDKAVPRYDVAATLFQVGRFAEARANYQKARDRADPSLRMRIDFALGNTALALGDRDAARAAYQSALDSRAAGPDRDAVRRAAAANLRFTEELEQVESSTPTEGAHKPSRKANAPRHAEDAPDATVTSASNPGVVGSSSAGDTTRRGQGGVGGAGPAPPQAGSPEARLQAALSAIQDARRRRLGEPPPPPDRDRKDW